MQLLLYISFFFLIKVIQIGFYLDIWTLLKYNLSISTTTLKLTQLMRIAQVLLLGGRL